MRSDHIASLPGPFNLLACKSVFPIKDRNWSDDLCIECVAKALTHETLFSVRHLGVQRKRQT